jgi:hypothetical protein
VDLQLPESRQFFCDCATGGAKIAHQHWIWAFIIWVTYSIISRGRQAEDGLAEWYLPGLGHWVQELPRVFYLALAVPGAITGLIYGLYAHQPLKIAMLAGAVGGSFLIPTALLLIDQALELIVLLIAIAIGYWIFCV